MDNALKKNLLSLDAAAKKHKVTPDAIKTWHKKGLIKAQLGSRGERLFSDDEIKTAKSNGTGAQLIFSITDGEGNFGLNQEDTAGVFADCTTRYNVFCDYY